MININIAHHIVGVHFFLAWSPANSAALPINPSLRIFFQSPSFVKRRIPHGIINIVKIAVRTRLVKINTRFDMKNIDRKK